MITITKTAAERMRSMINVGEKIRIYVKSGGCNGFEWDMEKVKTVDDKDEKVNDILTIDYMSIMYIIGSTLDYKKSMKSEEFTLTNERMTQKCGCGKSFSY